jgi:hypothetical protein
VPNTDKQILIELIERRGLGATLKMLAQCCDDEAERQPTYSDQAVNWDLRRVILHSVADHAPFLATTPSEGVV